MERYALKQLIDWKNEKNHKPLILQGARQVGKTWLMKEFGRRFYKNIAYINFDESKSNCDIFENDYDISRIVQSYMDKYKPECALRTSMADYKTNNVLFDIPLYSIAQHIKTRQKAN